MTRISAAHVSKTLRAAGLPKASGYKAYGHDVDGFIVMAPSKFVETDTVPVAFTQHYSAGREMCERATAALEAAGYVVRPGERNGLGGDYWLYIRKASA